MASKPKSAKRTDPQDYYWSKFKWRDWLGDRALRMCSPAARGVWMDMLAMMFESSPRGHLLLGTGQPPSMAQLAASFGIPEKSAKPLVDELEAAGVFSRTENGIIYSRRMVRDKEASDKGRAYGLTGGNPALKDADKANPDEEPNGGKGGGLTPRDNNPPYDPVLSEPLNLETDLPYREGKKDSELRSDAGASPDVRIWIFREGLAEVRKLTGLPDAKARSLVGKLAKSAGDDAAEVARVIAEAADLRPVDPVAWMTGALKPRAQPTESVADRLRRACADPSPDLWKTPVQGLLQ